MNTRRPEAGRPPASEALQSKTEMGPKRQEIKDIREYSRILEKVLEEANIEKTKLEKILEAALAQDNLDEMAKNQIGLLKKKEARQWGVFGGIIESVGSRIASVLSKKNEPKNVLENKFAQKLDGTEKAALAEADRRYRDSVKLERFEEVDSLNRSDSELMNKNLSKLPRNFDLDAKRLNQTDQIDAEMARQNIQAEIEAADQLKAEIKEKLRLDSGSVTEASAEHPDRNEDAVLMNVKLGLFAVADGLGGYGGGEKASRLAVEAVTEAGLEHGSLLADESNSLTEQQMQQAADEMKDALITAEGRIREAVELQHALADVADMESQRVLDERKALDPNLDEEIDSAPKDKIATTFVGMKVSGEYVAMVGIGDSGVLSFDTSTGKLEWAIKPDSALEAVADRARPELINLGLSAKLIDSLSWIADHANDKRLTYKDGMPLTPKDKELVLELVFNGQPLPEAINKDRKLKTIYRMLRRNANSKALSSFEAPTKRGDIKSEVRKMKAGELLIPCSDGLTDVLGLPEIEEFLKNNVGKSPQELALGLKDLAKAAYEGAKTTPSLRTKDKKSDDITLQVIAGVKGVQNNNVVNIQQGVRKKGVPPPFPSAAAKVGPQKKVA